jgi:dimethylamine monooxygenase subunit A
MSAVFKPQETFRDDFSFRNSPRAIRRFPLPFSEDSYMYSVNIEPHLPGSPGSVVEFAFDVDEHYVAECRERAIVLAAEPLRYQALPHMMSSQWDCLELIMESLARDYPAHFSLSRRGNRWHWINRPLQIDQPFTFGDGATLPREPLDYITRQAQGDFVVMDQREGDLWAEAGMVTTQADWSMDFDLGMTFKEWHGPVPLAHELQVFDRALKFLLNLRLGQPVRRLNWTMTIHPRLDTSPENYPKWGPDRATVTAGAECRRPRAPARGIAGAVAAAAQQRHRFRDSLLPDQLARIGNGAEVGAPRAPGLEGFASRADRLQRTDALSGCSGGMAGAFR